MCRQKLTTKDEFCKKPVTHIEEDLCTFHYNKIYGPPKKEIIKDYEGETKECSSSKHRFSNSEYPKERVPIEKFSRNSTNPKINPYKTCIDCRKQSRSGSITMNKEKTEKIITSQKEDKSEFMMCPNISHNRNISKYPREKVPREMFLKNPKDPDSRFFKKCLDCRIHHRKQKEKSINKRKEEAEKKGGFMCSSCRFIISEEEKANNINGNLSSMCKLCYEKKRISNKTEYDKWKKRYRKIQYEIILKNKTCCEICDSIFIKSDGPAYWEEIFIKNENGEKFLEYKGKIYKTIDFLKEFNELIEFSLLDFDHLTEKELRERNMLSPDEEYTGKIDNVSSITSEEDLREEVKKCRLICCRCHLNVTVSREKGNKPCAKRMEKLKYVNDIKKDGCSICKFLAPDFNRFLDLDHLDPSNKTMGICQMINSNNYSLDDVKKECMKTRVLCKFCHRIHTNRQREEGII